MPPLDKAFIASDHPADKALMVAMNKCFEYDWRKRSSSAEVRDFLREEFEKCQASSSRQPCIDKAETSLGVYIHVK